MGYCAKLQQYIYFYIDSFMIYFMDEVLLKAPCLSLYSTFFVLWLGL